MGEANDIVTLSVNPLEQSPVAINMTGEEGPLNKKSEPSAAMELHFTIPFNLTPIICGLQSKELALCICTGGSIERVKLAFDPAGIFLLQAPIRVFPSLPLRTVTW
jgi:hypothetical protein